MLVSGGYCRNSCTMAGSVRRGIGSGLYAPVSGGGRTGVYQRISTFNGKCEGDACGSFPGLLCGVALGFVMAVVMDRFDRLYQAFYPLIVVTQTIPTVAVAPLLVLWFGYEMLPKVILIVIVTFFPVTVGLLTGFRSADPDMINLLRSMGAGRVQIFRYIKLPQAMGHFFSSLRISASYSVVGAVISEWLGGFNGLGVYMTRVKKAFAFDKMFAVILLISVISLVLMKLVELAQRKCMAWEQTEKGEDR